MAWGSEFPVATDGTEKLNCWPLINQVVKAVVERGQAASGSPCAFPHSSFTWVSGTVTAATETTVSTGKTWCGGTDDTSGHTFTQPWDCIQTAFYEAPSSWDLVIDDNDPIKCIHVSISSWTNTGVITVPNLRDYVTSNRIPSIASLVGKAFYIIRGDYGIWWNERIISDGWINSYEYAKGTVRAFHDDPAHPTTVTNPTLTTIKDANDWQANGFASNEVLFYAEDGFLKRAVISANTEDRITFASQGSKPAIGSSYVVVTAGGLADPNKPPLYAFTWYRGQIDNYSTHAPDDSSGSAALPAKTVHTPGKVGDTCDGYDEDAYDLDVWSEVTISEGDKDCGRPADKPYTKNVWKTLRGLQVLTESLSTAYVEAKSYDGLHYIPLINPAVMFSLAGVNAYTATTGSVEGAVGNDGSTNNAIAISGASLPFYPIQVWYCIVRPNSSDTGSRNDECYNWGRGVMTAANRLLAEADANEAYTFTQDYDDGTNPIVHNDTGRSILLSPGFTRFVPRTFKRLYDCDGVFIPDIHNDPMSILPPSAIDPAAPDVWTDDTKDCYGVGAYVKRAKSTNYIERKHEGQSFRNPQGFAWEIGDTFADGDVARYVDDSDCSPSVYAGVPTADSTGAFFKDGPTAPYYERYYNGGLKPSNQGVRLRQQGGRATQGDTFWLRDTSQDWFGFQWFGGTMRTEEGTASSGSTTSLTDSSKVDPTPPSVIDHCYWLDSRFQGFAGPYVGFTVEILISGTSWDDPLAVIEKRIITSGDGTTITIGWAEPLSVSASGKQYRIKEPYRLNRYKDHKLILTSPDAKQYNTTVTGNSDDTLFFAPVSDGSGGYIKVDKDWLYDVIVPQTGTTWKRVSGAWQEAKSGTDAARLGVPVTPLNFHSDSSENLPTYKKLYGRMIVGDAITPLLFNELYACLNVLKYTKFSAGWVGEAVDGVSENNHSSGVGGITNDPPDSSGLAITYAETDYTTNLASGGGQPYCISNYYQSIAGGDPSILAFAVALSRQCGYAETGGTPCQRSAGGITFYDFGSLPTAIVTAGEATEPYVYDFDDNGDAVKNNLWASMGGTSTASPARVKLGSMAYPNGSFAAHENHIEGYTVLDLCAVIAWSFTYVT